MFEYEHPELASVAWKQTADNSRDQRNEVFFFWWRQKEEVKLSLYKQEESEIRPLKQMRTIDSFDVILVLLKS